MKNRLEELWQSADDGASSPTGPITVPSAADFDELMDAWYVERRNAIEFEMLLHQSRKLIQRMLVATDVSASEEKRARRLIRAIETSLRSAGDPPD